MTANLHLTKQIGCDSKLALERGDLTNPTIAMSATNSRGRTVRSAASLIGAGG